MPYAPEGLSDWPSPARTWNYLQGGKDYLQVDRDAVQSILDVHPDLSYIARQCRELLGRMVRFLAEEAGIKQILDLGCGLPAPDSFLNVHEIVQAAHPDGRVVYVDSDKVVLAHARALLTPATPAGKCDYIESDVREIESILDRAATTLDFAEPIGVIMFGVLGAIGHQDAKRVVELVVDTIPSGSYLAFEDGADYGVAAAAQDGVRRRHEAGIDAYELRTPDQARQYFDGLELVEPGLVMLTSWRPDPRDVGQGRPVDGHGCVARKP